MSKKATILVFLALAACKPAPAKFVRIAPPPRLVIDTHVEPMVSLVGKALLRDPKIDPLGLAIVEARIRFEHGEDLIKQGFLKRAKAEFDGALDLLLETSSLYPRSPRLDQEITNLVSKIHTYELAAFKDGDGFTDQTQEHAVIDDLSAITTTFPSPIDPKLKKAVEEDIAEIAHDLPIEINDRVLNFLDYYQKGRGRTTIELGLERSGKYQPMIESILKEEGVPQDLIYLAQAESAFIPRALSRAAAKGMWQFIPSRGKEYGLKQNWWIDERSDPAKSTRAAARHLKDLYTEFGDWYLAMAAYNAGPMRITKAMAKTGATDFWTLLEKKALPKETMNYVPTILALTIIGKNPERYGFEVAPAPPLAVDRVNVDKATDLRVIAEAIHVSLAELKDLNPHVLRMSTPPNDPEFELVLPRGYADAFRDQIASLPAAKRVLFRYHTVTRSETLSMVAKKYGTSTSELAQANSLSAKKPLRVGQELLIPMSGAGPATVAKVTAQSLTRGSVYTVRSGDTLSAIATRYGVSTDKLKEWNKMTSAHLSVGKKLVVAAPSAAAASKSIIHKVRVGETLNKIALAYKTTVGAIISWNKKTDLSVLHPGDQITIILNR